MCAQAWLPGRSVVEASLQQRHTVDESGEIVKLIAYCPWKEHIYDLEGELGIDPTIKFCLYEVRVGICACLAHFWPSARRLVRI